MTDSTLLVLSGAGVPPYSARGLRHTLEIIEQATSLRRTVNGTLVDASSQALRKYRLTVEGSDVDPPAAGNLWPGMDLTADCATELAYETATGVSGDRTAVPGSEREADGFTFYRPRLVMKVAAFSQNFDEWGAVTGWTLVMEEV